MTGLKDISMHAADLHSRAEDQVARQPAAAGARLMQLDARRLVHELQVHQIELEMQNAELQHSTLAQETLLGEYKELYDFAPVGYMSLDRDGLILKSNLALAALAGVARTKLTRVPFARLILQEDRPLFSTFLREIFSLLSGKVACELRLGTKGRSTIFAQLEAQARGEAQDCLVALTDVTKLRLEQRKSRIAADKLADSVDELELLTAELNLSEERERRRIALALHDQVVQGLAIGKLNLDSALRKGEIADHPVLQELQRLLDTSMLELRDLSRDLSPPILYDLGLQAAIASMGQDWEGKYGFRFVLHSDCPPEALLSENLSISVFQFYRELLMNVVKHSRAKTVTVRLHHKSDRLVLVIDDDGMGFNCARRSEGFGLANIRQRVNYLKGDFTIESSPQSGTRCQISIDTRCSEKLEREKRNGTTHTAC